MDEREMRADKRLLGWVVAFAVCVVVGVMAWNPLNLHLGDGWTTYCWIGFLVVVSALVWIASWSIRQWHARVVVAAVGMFMVAWVATLTPLILLFTEVVHDEEVLAAQGGRQLVHVTASTWIDPFHRVELRRWIGPLRQTVVVWRGIPEGDAPSAATFTGASEVEVIVQRYRMECRYRSSFDPVTLTVDVEHDDWRREGWGC
ncbi:hypothetical protein WEH80_21235 [Actinomycetes bacterium KLBMP 9759]